MNKIQKRIHQLVKVSLDWCKGTEYEFISYREHKKAWKEDIKEKGYTREVLIKKPIEDIFS